MPDLIALIRRSWELSKFLTFMLVWSFSWFLFDLAVQSYLWAGVQLVCFFIFLFLQIRNNTLDNYRQI